MFCELLVMSLDWNVLFCAGDWELSNAFRTGLVGEVPVAGSREAVALAGIVWSSTSSIDSAMIRTVANKLIELREKRKPR